MPKYEITFKTSGSFTFNTADYSDTLKEAEIDINDPDAMREWIRS